MVTIKEIIKKIAITIGCALPCAAALPNPEAPRATPRADGTLGKL